MRSWQGRRSPAQREEFEKTHECNFAIGVAGVGRFRVSCFYQRNQVGMVLRRIETRIPTIEELNLPPVIKTLSMTKRGIILFVGATGVPRTAPEAAAQHPSERQRGRSGQRGLRPCDPHRRARRFALGRPALA